MENDAVGEESAGQVFGASGRVGVGVGVGEVPALDSSIGNC